jgi:NodT family efflux transporter outer membrane factor (OMF) lipoprotein
MKTSSSLRRLSVIAVATLLGACSLIPTYQRPAAPVADAWPDAAAAGGTPAPDLPWTDFLPDARMRVLVDTALQNNRDLRIAVLNVEQARALYGVQRADLLPSVGAVVGASRAPGANGSISSTYSAGLAVSAFELDLFGRVRSLSQAALARYFASDEGRRAAQVSLIAAVANAELALRADAELLAVTQRTLDSRIDGLKLTRLKFDNGVIGEPDLRGAESLVAGARASLIALQRQRSQDSNALVLLIGQPLPATLPLAPPLSAVHFADLPAGLPSEVLLKRPDIRQAEQQLRAANANIGAARAAFFPRITLTGSAGFASNHLSDLFDNTAWTFAPQLLQPLFDAGRNTANLAAAKAAREIAVARYEKAIQTAFREVADALAGRATLSEQLAAQQTQADAEARRLQLAELLFNAGAASALDRLDAERAALAARQAVVQLHLAELQNAVLLYRVLGGGAGPAGAGEAGGGATTAQR